MLILTIEIIDADRSTDVAKLKVEMAIENTMIVTWRGPLRLFLKR
jgi:hypothetical protein